MSANGVCGTHGADNAGCAGPGPARVSLEGVTFHDVLRALNPLQYLPVVGTIYRLATGDVAPAPLRTGVSLIAGALTGGPVGLITSILSNLAENFFHLEDSARQVVTGRDPAKTAGDAAGAPIPARAAGEQKAVPSWAASRVADAYRSAGMLGSI